MQDYVSLPFGNHMGFLIVRLTVIQVLSRRLSCHRCPQPWSEALVRDAISFLRRTSLAH
jgi:ATP-dependent DNA helicase RecQ